MGDEAQAKYAHGEALPSAMGTRSSHQFTFPNKTEGTTL